jgi:uncharacterized protein YjiS (DUF1127 family)
MRKIDPYPDLGTIFSMVAMASPAVRGTASWQGRRAAGRSGRPWRRLLNTLRLWHERAQGRQQLREFDDHMLRDIGITRLQAEAEAVKPFWRA